MEIGGALETVADVLAREGVVLPVRLHDLGEFFITAGRTWLGLVHGSSP